MGDILVIEDSKTINKVLTNRLTKLGYDVSQAFTLSEAIGFLEVKNYDLIILDLHLPDGEGSELLFELQSLTNTKVIVLTSINDESLREELFRYGIIDYIIKDNNFMYSIYEVLKIIEHINKKSKDKILIIDDSIFICKQVKRILEPRNYIVDSVHNGKDGIKFLKENSYDLIILDMELPDVHGLKLLRDIRNIEKYMMVPIVVLSGTASADITREFLKNGANDYLKKPFIYEEFVLRIDLWIDYYKKEKELQEKTKELKYINENLQEIVKKEVEKNREKEKLLLIQSRYAQMGEMVAMIAHQWRQPLNAISAAITALELKMKSGKFSNEEGIKVFAKIKDYIKYLSTTIDDFKNFFKPQKTKVKSNFETIFYKALSLIDNTLEDYGINLRLKKESVADIYTYENELVQVVINILKNIIDVIKERNIKEPMIEVVIDKNTLKISDNASGIDKKIIDKIFDPYFSTKGDEGTGLGLYICKIIVEDHCKGELTVKNSEQGAEFTISLPEKAIAND